MAARERIERAGIDDAQHGACDRPSHRGFVQQMIMHVPGARVPVQRQRRAALRARARPPHRCIRRRRAARRTVRTAVATDRPRTADRERSRRSGASRARARSRVGALRFEPSSASASAVSPQRADRGRVAIDGDRARGAARQRLERERAAARVELERAARPVRSCPSQLNSVSRTRSGVGRKPGASAKRTTRPRCVPPMMRIRLGAAGMPSACRRPSRCPGR